jgi:TonB family protein
LRGQHGRVGVLEAFSAQSYAFTDEHMQLLGRLAGMAESAWARTHQQETAEEATEEILPGDDFPEPIAATPSAIQPEAIAESPIAESVAETKIAENWAAQSSLAPNSIAPNPIAPKKIAEKPTIAAASVAFVAGAAVRVRPAIRAKRLTGRTEQWWRYATIGGLAGVLVVLLAIFSWRAWYKASLPVSSTKSADTSQDVAPETSNATAATGSEVTQEAVARRVSRRSPLRATAPSSRPASQSDVEIRRLSAASQAPDLSHANTTTAAADSNAPAVEAPQIPESDAKPATVATLLTAPATLPSLKTTNTESFAGGVLVHKVLPVYPAQARQARIQGNVVLEAVISERGQIEDLKVVSGPPILAPAAVDAVRQWRYTPYLLNGKPIKKQTQINISFIAAQ